MTVVMKRSELIVYFGSKSRVIWLQTGYWIEGEEETNILDFWLKEIGDRWLRFEKQRRLEEEQVLNFKGR